MKNQLFEILKIENHWKSKSKCWISQNFRPQNFDFQNPKILIFKNSKFWFFKIVSEICPTLKSHNFFAIGPILKISDVPESSESLLSHSRVCFPGRFHESSPNRWIGNYWFWRLKVVFSVLAWNYRYRNPRYLENEAEFTNQIFFVTNDTTKLQAHRFWTESKRSLHRLCTTLLCNLVAVPLTCAGRSSPGRLCAFLN